MLRILLSLLLLTGLAGRVLAESPPPRADVPTVGMQASLTPSERVEMLLDLRSNSSLVRQPQQALGMADAMTEPEFLVAAMMLSANPEVWLKAIERAGSAGVPQNLAQITSTETLTDWFYSSVDPQYQQAVLSRMLDPKKPQRWMQAMGDPRFYLPALAMMNPATPMQWVKVTADGRMAHSMQPWFDPKTYLNWMRLPMPVPSGDKKSPPASFAWKPPQRY